MHSCKGGASAYKDLQPGGAELQYAEKICEQTH